jgi:hypothetical protein
MVIYQVQVSSSATSNISFTLAARILCYSGYGELFVVNMDLNNDQTVFSQFCIEKC